jgi:phosphatidylserine/phosphatidylglycerophosphate/cardiolipin synthase-like enzyme
MRSRLAILLFLAGTLLVVYFFFNARHEKGRPGRRGKQEKSAPYAPPPIVPTTGGGAIDVFFSRTYANDPVAARRDDQSIDRKMAGFIMTARTSLDCAFFEVESGSIADAIVAAHRRGVKTRIVADSDYRDNPEMQRLIDAGIPVVFDERAALMHNKFVVVDGSAVWTGSFNATDNCSFRNNNNGLLIHSPELAANYSAEFNEMFEDHLFGPSSPAATPYPVVSIAGSEVRCYFSPEDRIPARIAELAATARKSIHFLAFSFSDPALASTMITRHAAGVDVRGVVETRGSSADHASYGDLQTAGIDVLKDGNKYVMHHKVIVIDSLWTIVGSYNFTGSAAKSNDENILFIKSADVARRFEEEFGRIRRMAAGAG